MVVLWQMEDFGVEFSGKRLLCGIPIDPHYREEREQEQGDKFEAKRGERNLKQTKSEKVCRFVQETGDHSLQEQRLPCYNENQHW